MKYLAILLLAASPGPTGKDQVQVTTQDGAWYFPLPSCDGGTALAYVSDGGFSCVSVLDPVKIPLPSYMPPLLKAKCNPVRKYNCSK